jgi:Spy/CpxP family protein refolding chaperone
MKLYTFALFVAFATSAIAQNLPSTPIPEPARTQIELAITKLDKTQLQAQVVQSQAKAAMDQLQSDFATEQRALNDLVAAEKKALKLPDNAVMDQKTFTFSVPAASKAATPELKK